MVVNIDDACQGTAADADGTIVTVGWFVGATMPQFHTVPFWFPGVYFQVETPSPAYMTPATPVNAVCPAPASLENSKVFVPFCWSYQTPPVDTAVATFVSTVVEVTSPVNVMVVALLAVQTQLPLLFALENPAIVNVNPTYALLAPPGNVPVNTAEKFGDVPVDAATDATASNPVEEVSITVWIVPLINWKSNARAGGVG